MDRFDDLVVFVEVVDAGSLSSAAERLGMSPSAVSRRISQLEDRLGAQLLSRTTRRIALTEVGASFCHRARTILAALDDAERSVGEMGEEPRGVLRVACPTPFAQHILARVLPSFIARYPKVALRLNLVDRPVAAGDSAFDAMIRSDRLADSALIGRRLAPLRHAVLASPAYLARKGAPTALSDLAGHDCLVTTAEGRPVDWEFAVGSSFEAVRVEGALHADDPHILAEAAMAGYGLACLPTYAVAGEIRDGRLVPVLSAFALRSLAAHVIYPASRHLAPKLRVLVDHLVATVGQPAFWIDSGLLPPWEAEDVGSG